MLEIKTYSPEEVAKACKASRNTIYKELKEGRLGHIRLGRDYRIDDEDIKEWRKLKKQMAMAECRTENKISYARLSPPMRSVKPLDVDKMFSKFKDARKKESPTKQLRRTG